MKTSSVSQGSVSSEDADRDEATPTEAPPGREAVTGTTSRPQLVRSPPERPSGPSTASSDARPTESEESSTSVSDESEKSGEKNTREDTRRQARSTQSPGYAPGSGPAQEEARVARMREAMNSKLMHQQRMRRSQGSLRGEAGTTRVSPIQEESSTTTQSPSLSAVANNPPPPVRSTSTLSTESTGSSRTVRAGEVGTPAVNLPLRTPSYPFPYVPGTPKGWPSHGHQPFTTLSPTTSGFLAKDDDTPGRTSDMFSGGSTPAVDPAVFMPPGSTFMAIEDPRFPTPNLYDLVLQLNSEPGLEQWWATVTNTMHDHYKAERASLVMPMDPTDIENVPWGQKATFSMSGPEDYIADGSASEQAANVQGSVIGGLRPAFLTRGPTSATSESSSPKLHSDKARPRLQARHSYAGHGREEIRDNAAKPLRPRGPQRTQTQAAGVTYEVLSHTSAPRRFPSTSSVRQGSLGDPAFSSVADDSEISPYAEVFENLRSLDSEVRPLIESSGVNRVLERGRVVTVTRDYVEDATAGEEQAKFESAQAAAREAGELKSSVGNFAKNVLGNYRHAFASDNAPPMLRDYEEYEQHPASPWSQSPAPSPAIQSDEEANPFFTAENQDVEDAFEPTTTPKDYAQLGQVEAIGIDHASTVIHVPLIHPAFSKPMLALKTPKEQKDRPGIPKRSNTLDSERKAPIAILSILTSAVPYPHNLTQSLKLLGPHLATSLAVSQQFSATHQQSVTIRHRRTASGRSFSNAPMTIEPTSLADLVNADLEQPRGSISSSVTSPSEYSGRSKHSPASSIVGTPGWDSASHFWTSRSVAGTPGPTAAEMVDNYFETKKRSGHRNTSAHHHHTTPARPVRKPPSSESKASARKSSPPGEEEGKVPQSERKAKSGVTTKEETAPSRSTISEDSTGGSEPGRMQRPQPSRAKSEMVNTSIDKRHSQLHSYGADFTASFGGLATPAMEPQTPGVFSHARRGSHQEDMPPPSERLLRTIIDSVPVQIFTAEPETGRMTWVNQKFMIYRGQDARQVLTEPWQAIHPDDRTDFTSSWSRSLRTTQQLQQKVRLERFDGSYRWFYVRAAPLKDKRQKIVHWIGTMMDFHEQHIAEMNLARQHETAASEAKYRALANSSPQIVFAVNKTKGVTFCNTQWVHFSGQSEAQALGVGFMDFVHPEDIAKCKLPDFEDGAEAPKNVPQSLPPDLKRNTSASQASTSGSSETEKGVSSTDASPVMSQMPQRKLSELAGTGILKVSRDADGRPSYSTEVRLKSKEGDFRWHLVRMLLAEPMLQNENEEETWYGTCTDINDHKMLERDLKETMDEKSRFLSNMSHEIRTPLNGITGMVNFLIDSSLTSEQLEHVNIIRSSTEGLRGLINDILDLSKAEAGMIQLNMDWLYVRALIEEVNDLTSTMAIDKGLELNYLVEEDVPAQIKGDRFRIRQILLNIVGNAIKFTQKGEVFVRCSVQKSGPEDLESNEMFIRFDVIDTGRGFTEKEAEHLFKRFSQIDGSSTRQHGGTGLGLVISRQLAQLHGGDMSAIGVPDKGSTFTLVIKAALPSARDQPPAPAPPTPGVMNIPILPLPPSGSQTLPSKLSMTASVPEGQVKPSPKFALEHTFTQSPSPYATSPDVGRDSASVSSASSDPSLRSDARSSSLRSERSSASSVIPEQIPAGPPMKLALPTGSKRPGTGMDSTRSNSSEGTARALSPGDNLLPPMFSILVLCPLKYSREATVQHIDKTLPRNIPHQITARESLAECQEMIKGDDPVIFTHIVMVLQSVDEIVALVEEVLASPSHRGTEIVIITDLAQRRMIMEKSPKHNYDDLSQQRRLRFVFKPLKPSRFATIFDPQKEREMSTDRNQDSAQQVALTQKKVFDELTRRLGNKGKRVLLVEDNRTNQLVVQKFLAKVSIVAETAIDGVECTDKVFSHAHGYYSIILCDLHMPNKDGYQTCKEIRKWEREHKFAYLPIIALSANVLGDVYEKCVDAGFNSYMTKPVDFKELSTVLMTFMDPSDPSKPHELMKKRRQSAMK